MLIVETISIFLLGIVILVLAGIGVGTIISDISWYKKEPVLKKANYMAKYIGIPEQCIFNLACTEEIPALWVDGVPYFDQWKTAKLIEVMATEDKGE